MMDDQHQRAEERAVILFAARSDIVSLIGNGTLVAVAAFSTLGLAVGHLLGRPGPDGRAVLALSSATRHPAVALAIASANSADRKTPLAAALLFNIVGGMVATSYLCWIKLRITKDAANLIDPVPPRQTTGRRRRLSNLAAVKSGKSKP